MKLNREKMYRFGRSNANFSRHYDYLKDYYKRHKLNVSDLDCFERIIKVLGWNLCTTAEDFHMIETAIDETQQFLESRGYFKYGSDLHNLPYIEMLVIFAKKCVFSKPEYSDEYIEGKIDIVLLYYYKIIGDWEFLSNVESDEFNYLLLGRLLVIAGFEEYNKNNRSYKSEADFYYKALNIKEIIAELDELSY